jgi:hypothetical protein
MLELGAGGVVPAGAGGGGGGGAHGGDGRAHAMYAEGDMQQHHDTALMRHHSTVGAGRAPPVSPMRLASGGRG